MPFFHGVRIAFIISKNLSSYKRSCVFGRYLGILVFQFPDGATDEENPNSHASPGLFCVTISFFINPFVVDGETFVRS